jgi:hypothetical protein
MLRYSECASTQADIPSPGQFTVNERCTEFIYNHMTPEQKASLSPTAKFTITLSSGVIAGFAAAVLSHVRPGSTSRD